MAASSDCWHEIKQDSANRLVFCRQKLGRFLGAAFMGVIGLDMTAPPGPPRRCKWHRVRNRALSARTSRFNPRRLKHHVVGAVRLLERLTGAVCLR